MDNIKSYIIGNIKANDCKVNIVNSIKASDCKVNIVSNIKANINLITSKPTRPAAPRRSTG